MRSFRFARNPSRADAATTAGVAEANAQQVIDQLTSDRPTLSESDISIANSRRDFIREDVDVDGGKLLSELIADLRHALMVEDRPGLFLYRRYLPKRLQAPASQDWTDTSPDDVDTLRRLVREANSRLRDTKLDPIAQRAAEIRNRAFAVEREAQKRARASQTYAFQSAGEVKFR